MATRDNLLIAHLSGTAERHSADRTSLDDAVTAVLEASEGRADLLAREAATRLGAYLGRPHYVTNLRSALILATAAGELDGPAFVDQVDEVRRRTGSEPHGRPKYKPDGVPD